MPIATPWFSQITGEPELPPVVSAVYESADVVMEDSAPTCVWLVWFAVPVSTPKPVMRIWLPVVLVGGNSTSKAVL